MKESKVIVIVSSIISLLSIPILMYAYKNNELIYDIAFSIFTGLIISVITCSCQYFVAKQRIKNNIFGAYFELYKAIYMSEKQKKFCHYSVRNIYNKSIIMANDLSKNLSDYSAFIPQKYDRMYKKINPAAKIDFSVFNIKNFIKLFLPFNEKRFEKLMFPVKDKIEQILVGIDKKKFEKDFNDFKELSRKLLEGTNE